MPVFKTLNMSECGNFKFDAPFHGEPVELFQKVKKRRAKWPIWNYDSCKCVLYTLETSYLLS